MSRADGRLKGKVALITGAARGIGRAQAVRFGQEGADIMALDICGPVDTVLIPHSTPADLDETARQVTAAGGRITPRSSTCVIWPPCRPPPTAASTDSVDWTWCVPPPESPRAQWHSIWTRSVAHHARRQLDRGVAHLPCRRSASDRAWLGAMVLTNSIAGLRGLVGVAHYTAAKHGVVGLMRSLAHELAPHNVRVNCVHPTNVDTPLIQNDVVSSAFRPDLDRPPTRAEFAEAARWMNLLAVPWIEPVDVANATLFLASDEARYITAVTLPVDAGATQR